MNDLLNFVKLTPNMIYTLEHSEVCHLFTTLPGFVPYPRDRLVLEGTDAPSAKGSRTRTKKDHLPAVAKKKEQNGSVPVDGTRMEKSGNGIKMQPQSQKPAKDTTKQSSSIVNNQSNISVSY